MWEIKKLGDVAYLAGRIGWKGLTAKEYTKEGPLFLSVHGLNYGDFVDFRDAFHISQARYDESPEIMLRAADILICKDGAGIGKLGIIDALPGPATINSSLLLIRANEDVVPKYLYHALCSPLFQRVVQERIDGATTPHLYQREIRELELPVPPLPEQKRIVAILDEAFEGIDKAIANTEKNIANARELFDAFLRQIFVDNSNWPLQPLGEICQNFDSKRVPITKKDRMAGSVPYYGASGIVDYVAEHIFDEDLLLVSEDGANLVMRTYPIAFSVSGPCWVNNHAHVLKFSDASLQAIIEFYLNSISLAPYVSGMAQPKLNQKALNGIPVPVPPIEQRRALADRIEEVDRQAEILRQTNERKLTALVELKKSLLANAFTGQLAATQDLTEAAA